MSHISSNALKEGWFLDEIFYPSYHQLRLRSHYFYIRSPKWYLENDEENFIAQPNDGRSNVSMYAPI